MSILMTCKKCSKKFVCSGYCNIKNVHPDHVCTCDTCWSTFVDRCQTQYVSPKPVERKNKRGRIIGEKIWQ